MKIRKTRQDQRTEYRYPVQVEDGKGGYRVVYAHAGRYVIRLIPEEEAVYKLAGDFYSTKILHKVTDMDYSNKVYGNTIRKIEIGTGMMEFTNRCFNSASLESVTIPKDIMAYGTAFQGCANMDRMETL